MRFQWTKLRMLSQKILIEKIRNIDTCACDEYI